MVNFKRLVRALAPTYLSNIVSARETLERVSNRPWIDAWSKVKRSALYESRLSILPPTLLPLSFVIDVGSNSGQWIGALMELVPIREVWIFEPNTEAMRQCRERFGSRSGITYFDLALGDKDCRAELHVTAASNFASILAPRAGFLEAHYGEPAAHVVQNTQVQMTTLDSLVPSTKSVDLLKIDVQGFERAVLSGSRRVLERTRVVLIEVNLQSHYAGDETFPALWNQLADYRFSFWSLSPPYIGLQGESLWADAVFIKDAGAP